MESSTQSRNPNSDKSLAELTKQLTDQSSALAQKEIELAKAELTQKGQQIGIGLGAFGGAGALGFYAFGALTATIVLALATFLEPWISALIVTVAYAAIAGVMALMGKKKVEQATPPVPEQAVASTKQDIEHTKQRAKEGRR